MQSKKNKVCVLKFGALGDIVRTSYLINAIAVEQNVEITWITKSISISLLKNNPNIKELVDKDLIPMNTLEVVYDQVISLDDEYESAKIASNLRTKSLIGTFIKGDVVKYTEDTSEWFDMGLISKFGKNVADNLKKLNNKSHSDIFKNILHIEKNKFTMEKREKRRLDIYWI
jgi:heptosyltransferase-2